MFARFASGDFEELLEFKDLRLAAEISLASLPEQWRHGMIRANG